MRSSKVQIPRGAERIRGMFARRGAGAWPLVHVGGRIPLAFALVAALVLLPAVKSEGAPAAASLENAPGIDMSVLSPPSPDPAGIVYLPDAGRLLVSDSEVNETAIFENVNLWELTRSGSLTDTGLFPEPSVKWTEPTGLAFRPGNGTLFISDDDDDEIYKVRPGADGRYGTGDDVISSFDTRGFGARDPEGVTFDTDSKDLFIVNGRNGGTANSVKVFRATTGGNFVSKFDLAQHGVVDPEGIAYDKSRKTVLVLDDKTEMVWEFTRSGALKRLIDISDADLRMAAGVALAPASDGSGCCNLYIVDRGVDNNSDPNENDGMLFEMSYSSATASPSVTITGPADGSTHSGSITFKASAVDPEDGNISGSISWKSDRDGTIGTGGSISTLLRAGTHKITAWVTDSSGMYAADRITVNVLNKLPKVRIESPIHRDFFPSGADVEFTATASDPEDGNLTSSIVWKLKGSGQIGTGGSITESLPDGSHLVKAIVTDANGDRAVDKVRTFVGDGPYKFSVPIARKRDDAEQRLRNGKVILASRDLDLIKDRGRKQAVGLRFELPVPAGARILGARIQFEADKFRRKWTKLNIRAHRAANAWRFNRKANNLTDRRLTPWRDRVVWKMPRSKPWRPGRHGKWQRTPNLRSIVQWILDNRAAYDTYNHIAVIIKGRGSRVARSFEKGAPPVLRIRWRFP